MITDFQESFIADKNIYYFLPTRLVSSQGIKVNILFTIFILFDRRLHIRTKTLKPTVAHPTTTSRFFLFTSEIYLTTAVGKTISVAFVNISINNLQNSNIVWHPEVFAGTLEQRKEINNTISRIYCRYLWIGSFAFYHRRAATQK